MGEQQLTASTSLEAPTMVNVGDGTSPVMAIIEHLSTHECRMRSVNAFAIGATIDFSVAIHGAPTVPLRGNIVSCKQNGARFAYAVALQSSDPQTDAIGRVIAAVIARKVAHPGVPAGDGLTRASVRVPVDSELRYTLGSGWAPARATNISTGGLHMNTRDQIPVGASIELAIPLDSAHVTVHGRIVAHQEMSPNYNIAFYDLHDETREVIARFVQSRLPN
jgi:hypothetical protein